MDKFDTMTDWMSQLPQMLTTVPLWNLAIPGSHDSMTYCLDASGELEPNSSPELDGLKTLETLLQPIMPQINKDINDVIKSWVTTQDLTIVQQLHAGIRYFDMRVACKPDEEDGSRPLYFAKMLYTTAEVEETFRQMSKWLAEHPKEVVIISCKNFDGMNSDDHQGFITQLMDIFSNKLCPNTETPTLQDCWDKNYQVILSYADEEQAANQEFLWPWPETNYWAANQFTADGVLEYLKKRFQTEGRNAGFFATGLNLTPDEQYVLEHPYSSLHKMASSAYPQLMQWATKQQPGAGRTCINIIAADFVDPYFTQLVININRKE
ncbi:PI-PLC X domain-containing protein 1-like [Engraulis encrasicolus]|uniref:PI-PLC X domain-containing protein 1-like n=1 Tax=Engraulis encrasicolus TaxID=184585 RepID=UPI002FD3F9C7